MKRPPLLPSSSSSRRGPAEFIGQQESKGIGVTKKRICYDQIESTDWIQDSIYESSRVKSLRCRKDICGRIQLALDGAQGWILSAILGCLTAVVAYAIYMCEDLIFDLKIGYCTNGWYISEKNCCLAGSHYKAWTLWSDVIKIPHVGQGLIGFAVYVCTAVCLAVSSHLLTTTERQFTTPVIYYPGAGSGVAEMQVILSGFVFKSFLSTKVIATKILALVLSVASGLSVGKEGPLVHIAAGIGNYGCGLFSKYRYNDGKRREILSAATAAGIAVAFGAPIGGVCFSLEEVSDFPGKNLFQTFFCCITAAFTLKLLNPYGTNKIVIFEVRYLRDWEVFELGVFIILGILGGGTGAIFIKASRIWAQRFRIPFIKDFYLLEVVSLALVTGLVTFWNPYTNIPVSKLLFTLASPCHSNADSGLCPQNINEVYGVVWNLSIALFIKVFLTILTFGIKVPAGIYLPSMVIGGLLGRIIGHVVQWLVLHFSTISAFRDCAAHASGASCIAPGVYALVAAGSTLCGVTRLSVTIATILFELTGSLDYVLPFSIAILLAKWTADAIEPMSIYDLLANMNSYPFLTHKCKPTFTSDLTEVTHYVQRPDLVIDISDSPIVPAYRLHQKLELLLEVSEVDECLPITRDDVLVGLISAKNLGVALDNLNHKASAFCLMSSVDAFNHRGDVNHQNATLDFTSYIDSAPITLDIRSPISVGYECFDKLGLRYVCVTQDGKFVGLIHKKKFAFYIGGLEG